MPLRARFQPPLSKPDVQLLTASGSPASLYYLSQGRRPPACPQEAASTWSGSHGSAKGDVYVAFVAEDHGLPSSGTPDLAPERDWSFFFVGYHAAEMVDFHILCASTVFTFVSQQPLDQFRSGIPNLAFSVY